MTRSGDIHTLLLRNIIAYGVGYLSLLGLGDVLASLIWVLLAGAGYGSPDLVIAIAFPLELTVILVLCGALSLCVGHVLCLVLLHTHALVHRLALLLIDSAALLPGGGLAQSLSLIPTYLFILSCAHLSLHLLVLGVPQGDVLSPAIH